MNNFVKISYSTFLPQMAKKIGDAVNKMDQVFFKSPGATKANKFRAALAALAAQKMLMRWKRKMAEKKAAGGGAFGWGKKAAGGGEGGKNYTAIEYEKEIKEKVLSTKIFFSNFV